MPERNLRGHLPEEPDGNRADEQQQPPARPDSQQRAEQYGIGKPERRCSRLAERHPVPVREVVRGFEATKGQQTARQRVRRPAAPGDDAKPRFRDSGCDCVTMATSCLVASSRNNNGAGRITRRNIGPRSHFRRGSAPRTRIRNRPLRAPFPGSCMSGVVVPWRSPIAEKQCAVMSSSVRFHDRHPIAPDQYHASVANASPRPEHASRY